jgi:hypothetical protein
MRELLIRVSVRYCECVLDRETKRERNEVSSVLEIVCVSASERERERESVSVCVCVNRREMI